jgi:hypothetical protein
MITTPGVHTLTAPAEREKDDRRLRRRKNTPLAATPLICFLMSVRTFSATQVVPTRCFSDINSLRKWVPIDREFALLPYTCEKLLSTHSSWTNICWKILFSHFYYLNCSFMLVLSLKHPK